MLLETGLLAVMAGAFAALAWLTLRTGGGVRRPGRRELGTVVATLAVVATAAVLLEVLGPVRELDPVLDVLEGAVSGLLALLPLLIVRFAAAFEPVSDRVLRILTVITLLLVVAAVTLGATERIGATDGPLASAFLGSFVLYWTAAFLFAGWRLYRGSLDVESTVGRRRGQLLAAGTAGLGLVMVVARFEGALTGDDILVTVVVATVATLSFLVGYAPPRYLRWVWSRRDREDLLTAELALLQLDDPDELASRLLPYVQRLVGGRAAWLTSEGRRLAVSGDTDGTVEGRVPDVASTIEHVVVESDDDGGYLLAAPTERGWLVVHSGPYPVLFGAYELDAFRALAVRLDVAVDRARLRAREVEAVRRLEEARRLDAVDRVKDDVLATVSHELRTPLTTVVGATELLLTHWARFDEEDRRRFVQRVASNAAHLNRIVEDLLDLTRLRVGTLALTPRMVRLDALAQHVVGRLEPALRRHAVRLEVTEGLELWADPEPIERILEHLITNAAKFSPPGSVLTIEGGQGADDVLVVVRDQGPGLTDEELTHAFEPFYRAGDVLHRETRGLGVGLAVVAQLTEAIGATVDVASEPGGGSAFTLRLPRRLESPTDGRAHDRNVLA